MATAALIFPTSGLKGLVHPGTNASALAWVSASLEAIGREMVQHIVSSHHTLFRDEEAQQPKAARDDRLSIVEVQRAMREEMRELTSSCPGLAGLVDAFLDTKAAELLHIDSAAASAAASDAKAEGLDGDDVSAVNVEAVKQQWSRRKTEAVTDVDIAHLLLASQPAFAFNTDALVFVQVGISLCRGRVYMVC